VHYNSCYESQQKSDSLFEKLQFFFSFVFLINKRMPEPMLKQSISVKVGFLIMMLR
jgi:hypothetical protein